MSNDLVKRADAFRLGSRPTDQQVDQANFLIDRMSSRIEELEAAIESAKYFLEMHPAYSDADCRVLIKKALAEMKGEDRG
jgi:hypothetical protein